MALGKAGLSPEDMDYFIGGDLQPSHHANFCAEVYHTLPRHLVPVQHWRGLSLGAMLIQGGFAQYILIATSSHNCAQRGNIAILRNMVSSVSVCPVDCDGAGAVV